VYQVDSPHFVVHSDRSAERASELAQDLERRHLALDLIAFPYDPPFKRKTEVVEFSEWVDLGPVGSEAVGVHSGKWEWHTGMSLVVLSGKDHDATALIATHELTHSFVAHHLPGAPTWLNEGLAKYCETLDFEANRAVFGLHLLTYAQVKQPSVQLTFLPERVLSLGQIATLTQEQFYEHMEINYVSAWATVHALYSPAYRPAFESYLDALHEAVVPPDQAFQTALGAVDQAAVRRLAQEIIENSGLTLRRIPINRDPSSDLRAPRRLSDAEVLTLFARAATFNDKQALAIAQRAARLAPEDPEALTILGNLELASAPSQGVQHVVAAYRLAQAARRPRYAAAVLRLAEVGAPIGKDLQVQAARDLMHGARTPQELEALSLHLLRSGRARGALKYATKAVAADPGRPSALQALARVSSALGQDESAVTFQERAVNMWGHDVSPASVKLLAGFRAQAARNPASSGTGQKGPVQ